MDTRAPSSSILPAAGLPWVEVDARFHCPDRRTIAMTIVDGEGTGSVVETHATRAAPERCRVIEAVVATSPGMDLSSRWFGPGLVRVLGRAQ